MNLGPFRARTLTTHLFLSSSTYIIFALSSAQALIFTSPFPWWIYCLVIGTFLVFQGYGLSRSAQEKRTTQKEIQQTVQLFTRSQLRSVGMGALGAPLLCFFVAGLEWLSHRFGLPRAITLISWALTLGTAAYLGYQTGQQTPMMAAILKKAGRSPSLRLLLGSEYLGGFCGAVVFLTYLFPRFGILRSTALAALMGTIVWGLSTLLLPQSKKEGFKWILLFFCLSLAIAYWGRYLEAGLDYLLFEP